MRPWGRFGRFWANAARYRGTQSPRWLRGWKKRVGCVIGSIGGTFLYSATHSREKVLPRLVHQLVDAAFQGSAEGLVLTLLEGGRLSAEEVERIKAMVEKAELDLREEGQ